MRLLFFSDIHSDLKALERLVNVEADYYFAAGDLVSWAHGLDKVGEVLKRRAARTYVLPGNHESAAGIAAFCERFGFTNFHGKHVLAGESCVAGLGYSTPTPFNTPGEYTEEQMAAQLGKLAALHPQVLVCHSPPKNSLLDRAGEGLHFGSASVRAFIETYQPGYFFCGHIHEAEGVEERIGATRCVNAGKRGYLLEL